MVHLYTLYSYLTASSRMQSQRQLIKDIMTEDLKVSPDSSLLHICELCLEGKQHHAPFPHTTDEATKVLGQIYSNVHGPMKEGAHQTNCQWWGTFIDDHKWIEVYDILRKSDIFGAFKLFKGQVEFYTGKEVKCLHHDKGGKYILEAFIDYCKTEVICLKLTDTATPQ